MSPNTFGPTRGRSVPSPTVQAFDKAQSYDPVLNHILFPILRIQSSGTLLNHVVDPIPYIRSSNTLLTHGSLYTLHCPSWKADSPSNSAQASNIMVTPSARAFETSASASRDPSRVL